MNPLESQPQRLFELPLGLQEQLRTELKNLAIDLDLDALSPEFSRKIAAQILKLSDFYIQQPEQPTPWQETWAQVAYLSYYFPLNYLRAQAVISEANRIKFFNGIDSLIDFGSGLGSASLDISQVSRHYYIERSTLAQGLHKKIYESNFSSRPTPPSWGNHLPVSMVKDSLVIFSYSLTELQDLPEWAESAQALMILEPATQNDGRKLMSLRQKLIDLGFSIWAPCTHQGACPLLTQSKSDWCHDRIHFVQPPWFKRIEEQLPMKNRTLTTSYLLARKQPPPLSAQHKARTVGDQVVEKGKTRQLICQGPEREFLTWMDRDWKNGAPIFPRGILADLTTANLNKKSNELRVLIN